MILRMIKITPKGSNIDFIGKQKIALIGSCAALVISIIAVLAIGLNFGIDFRGGSVVEVRLKEAADIGAVRDVVSRLGLGDTAVQSKENPTDVIIRVEAQGVQEDEVGDKKRSATEIVGEALKKAYPGAVILQEQVIGPKVSGELVTAGITAVISAVLMVLGYIWLRFEWQFSIGAVAALTHDVILTIGVFSILQLDFNLAIVAAILTIVGYSLNDTVVVFDRVRENLRRYKSSPVAEVLNRSINETLSRTVMTSVTTLIALFALFILGGEVLRGFTFAMIWGVVVGTYSSVFIASPILNYLGVSRSDIEESKDKTVARGPESVALNPDGTPM
ncbi:MAG: protein translocase subunit SecF [Neomegalonema sp.]|nr:protein translocase subunit SecF [Neomegalonema sp.]